MNKENRFWEIELLDEHKEDLQNWIKDNELVGIVDEDKGGIIGYINRKHIDMIIKKCNN